MNLSNTTLVLLNPSKSGLRHFSSPSNLRAHEHEVARVDEEVLLLLLIIIIIIMILLILIIIISSSMMVFICLILYEEVQGHARVGESQQADVLHEREVLVLLLLVLLLLVFSIDINSV